MATDVILREVSAMDEALAIICDRMNNDDRISDALLREVLDCISNIREVLVSE